MFDLFLDILLFNNLIITYSSGYIPTPIFVYIEYVLLPTTIFINYLSQKLLQYIDSTIIICVFKNFSNYYPSWRQDIVVSYDTTYASRYVDRLPFSKIYLNPYLRGYFDEMRRKLNFWLRRCSGGRIRRTVPLRRRLQFYTK